MNIPPWSFAIAFLLAILIWSVLGTRRTLAKRNRQNAPTDSSSETGEPANAAAFRSFLTAFPFLNDHAMNSMWRDWMSLKTQDAQSLHAMLATDFRLEFKERALILLLAPPGIVLPENLACGFTGTDIDPNCLQDLPLELHTFAVTLIEAGIHAAYDRQRTYQGYQHCILQLFPQVTEELRERLYKNFSLRDTTICWKPEDDSRYRPWVNMLDSESISDTWKRVMDNDMRTIVRHELHARSRLRSEHKGAFRYYAETLQKMPLGKKLPYGTDLYADQASFALDLAELQDTHVYQGSNLGPALRLLDRQSHAELRRRLIANTWRHDNVRNLHGSFLRQAQAELEEIRDSHPETAAMIAQAIQEAERREQEARASEEQRKQCAQKLETAMRRA